MKCYRCGQEIKLEVGQKLFRQDTCLKCESYLRCCLNCTLYNPVAWKECREPEAQRVEDKTMANFCEFFSPSDDTAGRIFHRADEARRKLDDLFKKPADSE
ncbi:MAG: hypothetical protein EHM72_01370 [Calditrichaeota bacterium]|nr:MAG: hypothetical protein EHM72_01370 [Calditrichota bacterium]